MDAKKKTKIWIIVLLITLFAAGGLAALLSKKTTLFKGIFTLQQNPIDLSSVVNSCSGNTTYAQCIMAGGCTWNMLNNSCSQASTPDITPRPDLTVLQHYMTIAPEAPVAGNPVTFSAMIINSGNANAAASTARLRIDEGNNGSYEAPLTRTASTGPLASPGGSETETWTNAWTATAGTHKFQVCADSAAVVTESDNNNNCEEKTFTVTAAPPAAQPDLIAESLLWTPNSITAGTRVIFSANVRNAGTVAAAANFVVRFCIDNNQCAANTTGRLGVTDSIYGAALQPNTLNQMFSVPWTAVAGNHAVTFCVDVTNAVTPETLENNNCVSSPSFFVSAAAAAQGSGVSLVSPANWTNSDEIMEAGAVDEIFGKFQLTAASDTAIAASQLAFTKTGSLADNRLSNLRLFKNGTPVAAVQKDASNKWRNVGNAPISLLADAPVELELKGNIGAGEGGYDFTFSIDQQPAGGLNITSGTPFNLKHITVIGATDLPQANKIEPANNSTVSTLTPTLRWNTAGIPGGSKPFHFRWSVDDVTGAPATTVLYRDFNWDESATGPLNFPRKCPANAIVPGVDNPWTCMELQIPPGVLQYGHHYRWFVHVNNGDGNTEWCYPDRPHPYCAGDIYFNFTTPPQPPTVTVTASRPAGQSEQIPTIANQTVKLATLNISQTGGDPMLTKLKRIVLEYQTADNPLEINKITDLHLFRGDSSEYTLGTTGKDLIILSKNSVNGTIEAVFQTVTPVTVLGDARNQNITLYAKVNGAAGDNGKKIKYAVKSVEFEPSDVNQTNLNIAVPEFTMHEDPPDAPGATFQTSPASINRGQPSTLSWNVTNATTITIDNGIGTVSGVGTRVVNPTTDITYTLTASNAGGEITRTAVVAVAQPAPQQPVNPSGGGTSAPQTCEQQGLKTYTGPPKPGERVTGMCIACTTEQYIANGGTCEAKKKKKVGNMDAGLPQAGGGQGAGASGGAAATAGAAAGASAQQVQGGQRGAASEQTPNLQGSQRLVRAPERANTGPETLVYLGILGIVHAGLWLRKKIKR